MAESIRHMHSHRELAELLIKAHDIHEGHWTVAVEFMMGAALAGPAGEEQLPTGMVSIRKIGIQQAGAADAFAVDAAILNPSQPVKKRSPKPATATNKS